MKPQIAIVILLGAAELVSAQELKPVGSYKGHKFSVGNAALSPNGKFLLAGGGDTRGGDLCLWEVGTGKEPTRLDGHNGSLFSVAFSSDCKRLAAAGYDSINVWDREQIKPIATFATRGNWVTTLVFSPDGSQLGTVGWREARLWNVAESKQVASFRLHVQSHDSVAFSPDFMTLAAPNYQEIDLWDVQKGKERTRLSEHRGAVSRTIFSADGKTLISSSIRAGGPRSYIGEVKLWDVSAAREQTALKGEFGQVFSLALSPDGKTLALLDLKDLEGDTEVRLFDLATGQERFRHKGKGRSYLSVTFAAGKFFVLGSEETTALLWEIVPPER